MTKFNIISDLAQFVRFISVYTKSRLIGWGERFDKVKDIIVAFLVVKRGKYSQSFLNTSFLILISASLVGGPVIAENNPFIAEYLSQEETAYQAVIETDVSSISFQTRISEKPRDKTIEYMVKGGDTLASIAQRFDISVETIKWANNIKTDTIKPGQALKILPITGVEHRVKSGESIYSIGKKYGVEAQNIVNFPFNEFEDLDTFALSVDQIVYVPDGVIPEEKPKRGTTGRVNVIAGLPGSGNFIWPTSGYISQSPVYYHMALDIANKSLPAVTASDTGTVTYAACLGWGYGCHIIVDHGNGFQTLYAHLSSFNVSAGQGVSQGQAIGKVGSTGRSTGPHLHFEVRKGGVLQNPLNYLK